MEFYTVYLPERDEDCSIWGLSFYNPEACSNYMRENFIGDEEYAIALVIDSE